MNSLHLGRYGVKLRLRRLKSSSELEVTDGREDLGDQQTTRTFRPRRVPYDSIIIDGHSGYISLQALHWLSRNNIPVFILDFDGTLITSILPPTPIKADIRAAQMKAATDNAKRLQIAHALVEAKIRRSLQVLDWIEKRYDIAQTILSVKKEAFSLLSAKTVNTIRTVEGRVALRYWQAIQSIMPECFDFHGRMTKSHQNNAVGPVNLSLNSRARYALSQREYAQQ